MPSAARLAPALAIDSCPNWSCGYPLHLPRSALSLSPAKKRKPLSPCALNNFSLPVPSPTRTLISMPLSPPPPPSPTFRHHQNQSAPSRPPASPTRGHFNNPKRASVEPPAVKPRREPLASIQADSGRAYTVHHQPSPLIAHDKVDVSAARSPPPAVVRFQLPPGREPTLAPGQVPTSPEPSRSSSVRSLENASRATRNSVPAYYAAEPRSPPFVQLAFSPPAKRASFSSVSSASGRARSAEPSSKKAKAAGQGAAEARPFKFVRTLNSGTFGTAYLTQDGSSGRVLCTRVVEKKKMLADASALRGLLVEVLCHKVIAASCAKERAQLIPLHAVLQDEKHILFAMVSRARMYVHRG